jgi:hypothetical protein
VFAAERCASLIAHEHGHLMGLEHVEGSGDLMTEGSCTSCNGFENRDLHVIAPSACGRRTQNSWRLLHERLAPAPAPAPDPVGCSLSPARHPPSTLALVLLLLLPAALARGRRRRLD